METAVCFCVCKQTIAVRIALTGFFNKFCTPHLKIITIYKIITGIVWRIDINQEEEKPDIIDVEPVEYKSSYKMSGNSIQDFDLYFLQLNNEVKNKVYSPLSIKYALAMLNEGTKGDSNKQITAVIGDYKSKKYNVNEHMSFANAVFLKNSFMESVNESFVTNLTNKFGAEVIYDSFEKPDVVNEALDVFETLLDELEACK